MVLCRIKFLLFSYELMKTVNYVTATLKVVSYISPHLPFVDYTCWTGRSPCKVSDDGPKI